MEEQKEGIMHEAEEIDYRAIQMVYNMYFTVQVVRGGYWWCEDEDDIILAD